MLGLFLALRQAGAEAVKEIRLKVLQTTLVEGLKELSFKSLAPLVLADEVAHVFAWRAKAAMVGALIDELAQFVRH